MLIKLLIKILPLEAGPETGSAVGGEPGNRLVLRVLHAIALHGLLQLFQLLQALQQRWIPGAGPGAAAEQSQATGKYDEQ